jgi:hypothetical protein
MRNVQINFQQSSGKCKVDDCCEEEEDDLREFLVVLFLFILPPHTKDLRKNKVSISGFSLDYLSDGWVICCSVKKNPNSSEPNVVFAAFNLD